MATFYWFLKLVLPDETCAEVLTQLQSENSIFSLVCASGYLVIYNRDTGTTEAKWPLQEPLFKPLFISDSLETHCFQATMDSQHHLGKEWNKRKAYFCRDTDPKSSDFSL